ncbi:DUF5985 family protein [Candidatus Viadribacter manganicus]|uniref:Uncharacterized protein n=1 Tax=Candidatus Viadribacter manganicus TaxID=1759059 RepID=A0A1B1AJ58_9PROT|nr:DUF5985 family protein [Candidatus Viadribacter manganicus]ANP46592.1 hypothetical protein ATE48_12030 [Candidatus Viadribacter manganicus]
MFPHSDFFSGMITMGYFVASAFFLRFWVRTSDALFVAFSVAFLLLAISSALTVLLSLPWEERSWLYLIRLAAFVLLIAAILGKNFRKS